MSEKGLSRLTIEARIARIKRDLDEMRQYKAILAEDGLTPDKQDKERESALIVQLLRLEKELNGGKRPPRPEGPGAKTRVSDRRADRGAPGKRPDRREAGERKERFARTGEFKRDEGGERRPPKDTRSAERGGRERDAARGPRRERGEDRNKVETRVSERSQAETRVSGRGEARRERPSKRDGERHFDRGGGQRGKDQGRGDQRPSGRDKDRREPGRDRRPPESRSAERRPQKSRGAERRSQESRGSERRPQESRGGERSPQKARGAERNPPRERQRSAEPRRLDRDEDVRLEGPWSRPAKEADKPGAKKKKNAKRTR